MFTSSYQTMKKIAALLICFQLSSCASIVAHDNNGWGHAYDSTQMSACFIGLSVLMIPDYGVGLVLLPLSIVDSLASATFDTVTFPIDLFLEPEKERYYECGFH